MPCLAGYWPVTIEDVAAGVIDECAELTDLALEHLPARLGQAVHAALRLLPVRRIVRADGLFDQSPVEQPLDGFVQGAGPEPDRAMGPLLDVLLDRVAVLGAAGKGEQDVDDRQRKRFTRIGGRGAAHKTYR